MATNAVKVFTGNGEVLVFNVNGAGEEEYFATSKDDSDLRDYDESIMQESSCYDGWPGKYWLDKLNDAK